jgi:cephalosporin hydroxylase
MPYPYQSTWLGIPVIICPDDIIWMQEIVWDVKPDLIIETGVAYGGSVLFYSSLLELLSNNGSVIGIDITLDKCQGIENHPLSHRITLIEGSSIDKKVIRKVHKFARGKRVLVCLDSDHSLHHVYNELKAYAPLVSVDSYCVVFATMIEDMPAEMIPENASWRKGNNPKIAIDKFLENNKNFKLETKYKKELYFSAVSGGILKRCA